MFVLVSVNCPVGFTVIGYSCLMLSTSLGLPVRNWMNAKLSCESMGATLVSMKTEDKYKEVLFYLQNVASNESKESLFHKGLLSQIKWPRGTEKKVLVRYSLCSLCEISRS